MKLDEVLQLQVLKLKALTSGENNRRLVDRLIDSESGDPLPLRQMCAKVSVELYEDLEEVCGLLDMTKRMFIESAVIDALDRAHELLKRSGALEQGSL
jgi:hypothetical protein